MGETILLRKLERSDLSAVAAVHMGAFFDTALTKLGKEVVEKYYEWQLLGPHEVYASGAFIDGKCAGFCFGGLFRGATSGFLRHNRMFLVRRLLLHPWLITNPMIRGRIRFSLHVLKRNSKVRREQAQPEMRARTFAILAIAVDPQRQGQGIGKLLMDDAEATALTRKFDGMDLFVKPDNRPTIGFYESLEWKKVARDGKWSGNMAKSLTV